MIDPAPAWKPGKPLECEPMNLAEWSDRFGRGLVQFPGGNPHVCAIVHGIGQGLPGWAELYRLTDYSVSSVTGGSIWLKPLEGECTPPPLTMADASPTLRVFLAGCVESMVLGRPAALIGPLGVKVRGQVNRVEREDGSGRRFNVYMADSSKWFVDFSEGAPRQVRGS